jgi:hypothetical protein
VHARLVENIVFQSSLLDWVNGHASDAPLRFHVFGTALMSALVSMRSISFEAAVESATRFGLRWDGVLRQISNKTEDEIGWHEFTQVSELMDGRSRMSLSVSDEELPRPDAPLQPFWYSATATSEPVLITTAQEAATALKTMNLNSWCSDPRNPVSNSDEPVRGWLVSPLHPMARVCRWSVSNYLLSTPSSVTLFLDHIATLGRKPLFEVPVDPIQNRLRLSRMKVTGP